MRYKKGCNLEKITLHRECNVTESEDTMELEISVEDLLNKRKIESDRIEFKAGWNLDDIYHSVCAFANDYNNDGGGYIAVGVEEAHGIAVRSVKGIPEYLLEEDKNVMENLVAVI